MIRCMPFLKPIYWNVSQKKSQLIGMSTIAAVFKWLYEKYYVATFQSLKRSNSGIKFSFNQEVGEETRTSRTV